MRMRLRRSQDGSDVGFSGTLHCNGVWRSERSCSLQMRIFYFDLHSMQSSNLPVSVNNIRSVLDSGGWV